MIIFFFSLPCRKLEELQLQVLQQEDMLETQEELICSMQASSGAVGTSTSQTQPQPTAGSESDVDLTVTFSDNLIGLIVAYHPVVSNVLNDFAKSNGVKVSIFSTDDKCIKATLSGSQTGTAQVQKEILDLDYQLQFDIETHTKKFSCMFAPLLISPTVVSALAEIEKLHHMEISIVQNSKSFISVDEFSSQLTPGDVGKPMCVTDLRQFISLEVPLNFEWQVKNKTGQVHSLGVAANQHLNQFWNFNSGNETTFTVNGMQFVADISSLELLKVSTGETFTLIKDPQQPTWSYAIEANKFIYHEKSDSKALEKLYRYGGSFITLAGNKHTLDLVQMQQIDLKTGEKVSVKRHPAITRRAPPEFDITLSVRGLGDGLDAGVQAIQQKLESLITSCTVTSDFMTSVPLDWQEIILVQVFNAARQYCVKIGSFGVENGKLKVQLHGAKDTLDKVQVTLKEHCLELQHHVISVIDLLVQKSLQDLDNRPLEWEEQKDDVELFNVKKGTSEWTDVLTLMKQTIPRVNVVAIQRVQNLKLWDKYALEKKHMSERNNGAVNEKYLFHGTRDTHPHELITAVKGIDFRYSRRDYQLLWGIGVYFAVNASYSNNYCYVDQNLKVKQLLLVKVLTGKSCSYGSQTDPSLTRPPCLSQASHKLYDTVNGYTNGSYVYVVYDHDRAYPAYLISYHS